MVVLAGSAGALHVILPQLQRLSFATSGAVFVVYHRQSNQSFRLGDLVPACRLAVREAADGERVTANTVHCPRDADDLQVRDGRLVVTAPGQRHHPNIDLLLTSLAKEYGPRVVAVLLSGMGTDGLQGLRAVRQAGGQAVVQDPESARFPALPAAAIAAGLADQVGDVPALQAIVEAALAGRATPAPGPPAAPPRAP